MAQQGRGYGNKPPPTAIAAPSRHQGGVGAVRYARQQLGAGSACPPVSREQRKPLLSLNQWLNRGGIMGRNLRQPPSQPRAATKAAWGRCDQARQQLAAGPARPPPRRRGGEVIIAAATACGLSPPARFPGTKEAPVELESVAQQGRGYGNKPPPTAIAAPSRHQGGVGAVRYARQQLGAGSACPPVSREQRKPLLSLNQWLNRGGFMGTNLRQPPSQPRAATMAAWGRGDMRGSNWPRALPARHHGGGRALRSSAAAVGCRLSLHYCSSATRRL